MKGNYAFGVAVVAVVFCGCGGVASGPVNGGSGGDSGISSPTGGADASSPINPGAIGGLFGAMVGSMGADAGAGVPADNGGSTAMPSTRQVVDGCNEFCNKSVGATCSAGGTLESCVVGCRLILANASCASAAQKMFSCVKGATASCDGAGNVVFAGCQVAQWAADVCFLQSANDPGLKTPCSTYCAAVTAAKCPNDNPAGCQGSCQILGNLVAGCGTPWRNYVNCANGSALTCSNDGKASAAACITEALSFWACTAGGLATILSDGGM